MKQLFTFLGPWRINEDFPSHSPEDLRKYFSSDALEITTVSP